jgi:hypothetical protein
MVVKIDKAVAAVPSAKRLTHGRSWLFGMSGIRKTENMLL